ncbi:hypothetical protein H4R20_007049, partial [Coemansia guatemalensis]
MAPLNTKAGSKAADTTKDSPNAMNRQRKRIGTNARSSAVQSAKHTKTEGAPKIPGS